MDVELFAPEFELLNRAHNKFSFIGLCSEIGLDVPRTHLMISENETVRFEVFSRDLVFKPVWSRFGSHVLIRPDAARLRQIKPTASMPWVAQDYISGDELCVYSVARQGRIVALATYRGLVRTAAQLGDAVFAAKAICLGPLELCHYLSVTGGRRDGSETVFG